MHIQVNKSDYFQLPYNSVRHNLTNFPVLISITFKNISHSPHESWEFVMFDMTLAAFNHGLLKINFYNATLLKNYKNLWQC